MAPNRKRTYSSTNLGAEQASDIATNSTSTIKKQKVEDENLAKSHGSPHDRETIAVVIPGIPEVFEMTPDEASEAAISFFKINSAGRVDRTSTQANFTTKRKAHFFGLDDGPPSQGISTIK